MGILSRLKNDARPSAVAVIAAIAVEGGESGGITAKTAKTSTATPTIPKTETPSMSAQTTPPEAPSIPVPKYSIGDRVSFLFRDSRTTKGGVVEDLLFNAAAKWWYRIDADGKTMWAGESHITGRMEL